MKYHCHLLLLGIATLAASCSKDTPKPEPQLLGRWNAESTTGDDYSATGQLINQQTVPDKSYYLVLTPDSLLYRNIRDDSNLGRYKYTRQGNELRFGRNEVTITKLTDHALSLRFKDSGRSPGMPYQELEDNYTR